MAIYRFLKMAAASCYLGFVGARICCTHESR